MGMDRALYTRLAEKLKRLGISRYGKVAGFIITRFSSPSDVIEISENEFYNAGLTDVGTLDTWLTLASQRGVIQRRGQDLYAPGASMIRYLKGGASQ